MQRPADAPPILTERFLASVRLAAEVHRDQRRKGTLIPYLAHLLVVTGLVIEDGGNEDQAIAAMLHDAVEDGGGRPLLERIERDFGRPAAAIVEGCSDTIDPDDERSWIDRKRSYLAHLAEEGNDGVLRVALADKVHNCRSIVRDYRDEGEALWERFAQKTARDQLWYYGALLEFFERRRPGPLTEDLRRAVAELAWLVASNEAQRTAELRLWVDHDLHDGRAPAGWVQVRTAGEAIQLMDELMVRALSFKGVADAQKVIDWLADQSTARGRDRWPREQIALHREPPEAGVAQLDEAIRRHSSLRRTGPGEWIGASTART